MPTRNNSQNNLYHLIIAQAHKEALKMHTTLENKDHMRKGLKDIDLNYPKEDGKSISSAKLTTKQMKDHTEFIIDLMTIYGIELQFVKDDFERTIYIH